MGHVEDALGSADDFDETADPLLGPKLPSSRPMQGILNAANVTRTYILLLHIVLLGLIMAQWSNTSRTWLKVPEGRTWSPVHDFIEYEVRELDDHSSEGHGPLAGRPTDEQDRAWDRIVNGSFFSASYEELARAGETLENLAELTEGGYMASIGVYHELHCLRQLRLYLYRDLYYPNLTETDNTFLKGHLDHCLEGLRKTVMCYGNTAVTSFYWADPQDRQPLTRSNARAVCARWQSIEGWSDSRRVSVDPDYRRWHGD